MIGKLRLNSVVWMLSCFFWSGASFPFEPAQEPPPLSAEEERALVVAPKLSVEVFQSNYRPIMPRLAGEYVFYSSLNERDTRLGCSGRHLYALPVGKVRGSRQEQLVAKFECVLQLQAFGKNLYVIHRFTPTKKEGRDPAPAPELRIDKVDAEKLKIEIDRFPEVIGERGQAAHQVRFAVKMDDLGRSRDTQAQRTSLINQNELFVLAETGSDDTRETFLDILDLEDPWSNPEPLIDIPIQSEPIADFLIPGPNSLIVALDGGRLKMGKLLFFSWDGKELKLTKEIGERERLSPDWSEVDEDKFAIRHPRFLALTPGGMVGSEKGSSSGQQFVFYFSWEDKKAYKVKHLSKFLTQIAGFEFVQYNKEPGLLVADSDNRWIHWYGNKSPFPEDMIVKPLGEKTPETTPEPKKTSPAPRPTPVVPDEKLVPEENPG